MQHDDAAAFNQRKPLCAPSRSGQEQATQSLYAQYSAPPARLQPSSYAAAVLAAAAWAAAAASARTCCQAVQAFETVVGQALGDRHSSGARQPAWAAGLKKDSMAT